jgi:hypothetical protein
MGEKRDLCRVLVRKPEGKRPLERSRHRRKDNIKMDVKEIDRNSMEWVHLAWDRDQCWALINTEINLQVA